MNKNKIEIAAPDASRVQHIKMNFGGHSSAATNCSSYVSATTGTISALTTLELLSTGGIDPMHASRHEISVLRSHVKKIKIKTSSAAKSRNISMETRGRRRSPDHRSKSAIIKEQM
ncbi:hypothetical protein DI09_16p250 [Mitosporidium daphniae]|uniref:Uncharacterized protein n=1 Tax=Mitosporidium daphniae TaxID=1485682 RepID=A0A098VXK5_9MICR|nr:uncharacterized protein DI09_16p250 [Mitosporidium daphniae]KGG52471.1 hypothetical protein DI09_16p250 [Mitosporidium daphniae]|eukprot:XP_013238898.1 uncharacterized protein DI09_16p250 [Mitosporidium daphniae]